MKTAAKILGWIGFIMCSAWLVFPLRQMAKDIGSIKVSQIPQQYVSRWVNDPFLMLFLHGIIVLLIAFALAIKAEDAEEEQEQMEDSE